MTKEGYKAAGRKKEAQDNLYCLNVAMHQLRKIQPDKQTHGLKRRALENCAILRKVLIDQINEMHTKTYKEEAPNHESIDLCSRSADRNAADGGEQVQRAQGSGSRENAHGQ